MVPSNEDEGIINNSPSTNLDPPLVTVIEEIDPVVSNVTFNTAPDPERLPEACKPV